MISNGVDGFPATPETLRVSEGFGSDFIIVDDIDGDGIRDAALGSPWADSPVRDTEGMVWILFMNADGTVRDGYVSAAAGARQPPPTAAVTVTRVALGAAMDERPRESVGSS